MAYPCLPRSISHLEKRGVSFWQNSKFPRKMLTEVSYVVACLVKCPPVELEPDDGEDDDGKEEEEGDVDQGTDGLCNG